MLPLNALSLSSLEGPDLDISHVREYAKIVALSVGLMSKYCLLASQKASDSQSISTIHMSVPFFLG
jgi:hypothetical protein